MNSREEEHHVGTTEVSLISLSLQAEAFPAILPPTRTVILSLETLPPLTSSSVNAIVLSGNALQKSPYDIDSNARLGLNATLPLINNSDRDDLNQNAYDGDGSNQNICLDRNGADGEGLNQAYLPDFPRLPVYPNFRWTDPHLLLISTMLMKRWSTGRGTFSSYQLENLGSLLCQNLPVSLMPMLVDPR